MTSLTLTVKAKRDAAQWHITCEETWDTVYSESLEDGLHELIVKVMETLTRDLETPRRIVLQLEGIQAKATIKVSFQDNRDLGEFEESEEEEDEEEDAVLALPEGQRSLPPGEEAGANP